MKKLLFLVCAIFALNTGVQAQLVSTPTYTMTDTLHYYLNKHYFKTGINYQTGQFTPPTYAMQFPFYKAAASTVTNVTHVGSKFEVCNNDTVVVTGLEAFAARNVKSALLSVKINLYLCNLDNNGLPVLPPIDSIQTAVGGTLALRIGGDFPKPHKMTKDYAVLFRNMSTIAGDTACLLRTDGRTYTNTNAPANLKYSDSYGFVRFNAKFYPATNFTLSGVNNSKSGFGYGTDYEFCVAPRVQYNIWAAHTKPVNGQGYWCTFENMTFQNNSCCEWTHRMYNLIHFYRKWNLISPFVAAPPGGWPSDSSITWFFEPEDDGNLKPDPRAFLLYGANSITFYTDSAARDKDGNDSLCCFPANEFRAHFRPMSILGAGIPIDLPYIFNDTINMEFELCTNYCGKDFAGLPSYNQLQGVKVFPNPAANGRTVVSGLQGSNRISVYSMTGQLLSTETTGKESVDIDLSRYQNGAYIIRIIAPDNRSKVVRVVNQ